ncbi:MAG: DUF1232 domain-containing protein [Myxococcales bacterium]|nr:DUF1232 domain-containing protein [Myxococcales bacterium]
MMDDAVAALRARVLSLPLDLKAMFAVVDDQELPDELRLTGAAAIFYYLNPANLIPSKDGMLGLADDAIALRCALDEVRRGAPLRAKALADHAPEAWAGLEQEIALLAGLLGDLWAPVCEAWRAVGLLEYRGKSARGCVDDAEDSAWLYAAVEEALSTRDIDEQAVIREIKKEPLLAKLQQRLATRKR